MYYNLCYVFLRCPYPASSCIYFLGSTQFQTNWEANPDETKKNKSYVYYTLGNLEPNRGYIFRIIAWNAIGRSPPSDPSDIVFTGNLLLIYCSLKRERY